MERKAKGMSCHIGLNRVDPGHYQGWSGPLSACEYDARDMRDLADAQGFTSKILLTEAATREAVLGAITEASESLTSGDIFFITYSGHGGQVPDVDGDERDMEDETWCLYDGELIDDELGEMWRQFQEGVRILVLSDSCHSGTVIRLRDSGVSMPESYAAALVPDSGLAAPDKTFRMMPIKAARDTYMAHSEFYDGIARKITRKEEQEPIRASVRLISGCQDNQLSLDGTFNGLFTGTVKKVWASGQFEGNYDDFHKAIVQLMPPYQSPNHYKIGTPNEEFDSEKPFTV